MEHRGARARKSACWRNVCSTGCATGSPPAACCIMARANGIPANSCPRWALTCYWRTDGVRAVARPRAAGARGHELQHSVRWTRSAFRETLARRLGRRSRNMSNPAFEDPVYYLQRERSLPINVDPVDNHLEDPIERERVRRVFERGLSTSRRLRACRCSAESGRSGPEWQTGLWMLRGQHLFLVPGRFAGRPAVAAGQPALGCSRRKRRSITAVDPMVKRGPLPVPPRMSPMDPVLQSAARPRTRPQTKRRRVRRPGSCAPPFAWSRARGGCTCSCRRSTSIEDYVDLLAAIEDTAAHLEHAGGDRRLHSALRSADRPDQGHPRSRRDRGQRQSRP